MISGPLFRVDEQVPTDGFRALFTLRSDLGTFTVPGRELLKIRIAELSAIQQLDATSKTNTFLNAAWVAFSGRLGVDVLTTAFVPISTAITLTSFTSDLVYDTPKADLIVMNKEKMIAMGAGETQAQARLNVTGVPIEEVKTGGTVVGVTPAGSLVVPAPVDFVSWTERIGGFAERPDLRSSRRTIWLTGRISGAAHRGLTSLGWTLHEVSASQAAR